MTVRNRRSAQSVPEWEKTFAFSYCGVPTGLFILGGVTRELSWLVLAYYRGVFVGPFRLPGRKQQYS